MFEGVMGCNFSGFCVKRNAGLVLSFPTFANVNTFKLSWGLVDVNEGLCSGYVCIQMHDCFIRSCMHMQCSHGS